MIRLRFLERRLGTARLILVVWAVLNSDHSASRVDAPQPGLGTWGVCTPLQPSTFERQA